MDKELWSEILGSGWETWDWWQGHEYAPGADWDQPGSLTVTVVSPDDDADTVTVTVSVEQVAAALDVAIRAGLVDACTGVPISRSDEFDWDACSGDTVMQMAVFGEVVYG